MTAALQKAEEVAKALQAKERSMGGTGGKKSSPGKDEKEAPKKPKVSGAVVMKTMYRKCLDHGQF